MKRRRINTVLLMTMALSLVGAESRLEAAKVYDESGGLVIMEVENTESPLGLWKLKTSLTPYTGSGYLEFTGNDYTLGDANSPLVFNFKINQGGTYTLDLRCAKMKIQEHTDWANDCYVRVVGDFTSGAGPHDIPGNNASLNMLKTNMKFYGGAVDAWEWAAGDLNSTGGRLDPGGKNNKRKAVYNFKSGATYTLVLSGRSKSFRPDRILFRRTSVTDNLAHSLTNQESSTVAGTPPTPDDMDVEHKATKFDEESHPGNDATVKKNGRADVGEIQNGSWICFKRFNFGAWTGGTIDIQASSANAGGTVEVRTDSATGPLLGTVAIRKTWGWSDYTIFSANVAATSGTKDIYFVFKGGSGSLFNLKEFTFRSGETEQEKLAVPPVNPPPGRVAYVADGNSPDPDDIGGTAAALAMLRAVGLDHRLVHCSHSCDLIKADNITTAQELGRQKTLQTACDGTVSRWGGFKGITFWNCRTQQKQAVNDLRDAINASTVSDPLWIIEAGEPDIIGYALEAATEEKRQFVKIITHHPVNDGSGDYFKWSQMENFGTEVVRIPDQNGGSFADLGKGLQRPLWAFNWARESKDGRIQWLWEQVKIAEQDPVVGFQKNKCDISDAGMMFYWITGANVNGGYRTPTMDDVQQLFEKSGNAGSASQKVTP